MINFPNTLNYQEIEKKLQKFWLENQIYAWHKEIPREDSFVIDTPPPTVSGLLHMGHVFSYTQADFIARFQRMTGKNVFYPIGFDDNGLPTERLVEKVKQIKAHQLPRQEFIETCQLVVKDAEEEFRNLFKSLALSVDWKQEYQTISPTSRRISQLSFLDLFHKGECYKKFEPCLWDIVDQTALAQADIVDKEITSKMNNIVFISENGEKLVIATTRPELLAACVAIFYHPDDKRYIHLANQFALSPLFNVKVPIIADEHVDIEKGTGLVMCCTFGDATDIEWWKKHNLPTRIIIDKYGKLSGINTVLSLVTKNLESAETYASELSSLKIEIARARILEILQTENLLISQTEITRSVKCAERSGSPLEILITQQWFVKILDKKAILLEKANEINWYPNYMKARLDNWINGLSWDWCISRQRYFGVPFPVWYSKRAGEEGKIIIAKKETLPVDPLVDLPEGYSREEVEADNDVMDTWATSGVSPQLNSLAINQEYNIDTERHNQLFPADLRPQAHEIIRTWAFYTITKSYIHQNSIPWKNIMISGWCLAADKTKMSKSKGNVVTPINLIEEKGVDVIRYWASNSRLGADIAYSEEVFAIGKKLTNKIWNAAKFASIHLNKLNEQPSSIKDDLNNKIIFTPIDLWILHYLNNTIKLASTELKQFEYCTARCYIEEFFWNYCDNYLEIVKTRSYNESGKDSNGQQSAIRTMYHCFHILLKLFAPYLPYLCEELYQHMFAQNNESIHSQNMWPEYFNIDITADQLTAAQYCISILDTIRKLKADKQISIKAPITKLEISGSSEPLIALIANDLLDVINASSIVYVNDITVDSLSINDKIKLKASFE